MDSTPSSVVVYQNGTASIAYTVPSYSTSKSYTLPVPVRVVPYSVMVTDSTGRVYPYTLDKDTLTINDIWIGRGTITDNEGNTVAGNISSIDSDTVTVDGSTYSKYKALIFNERYLNHEFFIRYNFEGVGWETNHTLVVSSTSVLKWTMNATVTNETGRIYDCESLRLDTGGLAEAKTHTEMFSRRAMAAPSPPDQSKDRLTFDLSSRRLGAKEQYLLDTIEDLPAEKFYYQEISVMNSDKKYRTVRSRVTTKVPEGRVVPAGIISIFDEDMTLLAITDIRSHREGERVKLELGSTGAVSMESRVRISEKSIKEEIPRGEAKRKYTEVTVSSRIENYSQLPVELHLDLEGKKLHKAELRGTTYTHYLDEVEGLLIVRMEGVISAEVTVDLLLL